MEGRLAAATGAKEDEDLRSQPRQGAPGRYLRARLLPLLPLTTSGTI